MLRVVEAFSGIGSQAKALKKLGIDHEIKITVDWDISAIYAYDIIHNGEQDLTSYEELSKEDVLVLLNRYGLSLNGKEPIKKETLKRLPVLTLKKILCALKRSNNVGSITDVTIKDIPKKTDLLTYSFPCQDLSICGSWHGNMSGIQREANNRSGMLWEVERILKELKAAKRKLPKFLLMENVSNILAKPHRENFAEWKLFLESLGYINQVYTLDASKFGIPQRRVRTYMLSVLCPDEKRRKITTAYFTKNNLENVDDIPLRDLSEFLRTDYSVAKYREEADRSNMNDTPSRRKIFEDNEIVFDGEKCVLKTVNTLTTKQDRNPTSGMIIYPKRGKNKSRYRNLTPRECFLLMGFDEEDYDLLIKNDIEMRKGKGLYSRERCEKLAGNSIVVDVLVAIFKQVDELNSTLWSGRYLPVNGEKRKYTIKTTKGD